MMVTLVFFLLWTMITLTVSATAVVLKGKHKN